MPNPIHEEIIKTLRQARMIGKIWPVFKYDKSPTIYGLLVSRPTAVAEANYRLGVTSITEEILITAIRKLEIHEGEIKELIKQTRFIHHSLIEKSNLER